MTEGGAEDTIDLGEYEAPAPITPEQIMSDARFVALSPKPTIEEMIELSFRYSCNLEAGQFFLMATGDRERPAPPKMRDAAVLTAMGNFLALIATRKHAVAKVLKG